MDYKYEVTVTLGVRELGPRNAPGFQASDTFTVPVKGFDGLATLISQIHDLAESIKASGGAQDKRS